MKKSLLTALVTLVGIAAGWLALTSLAPGSSIASWAPCPRNWSWAPAWQPRTSPLEAVPFRFDTGAHGKLCYGRPSLRGRQMIGGASIPYGQLWRTGANEPTTLHLDTAVRFGELELLPGSYSIYTVPGQVWWEVVVNRSTRQWGLESEYDDGVARQEVGRFRIAVESLSDPVETFTVRAVGVGVTGYLLVFEWERTRLRVPLSVGLGDA